MEFFCKICDRSIIEDETEYYEYLATLRKKNDKCFYKKYTFNNVNLDAFDKILSDYITTQNKNLIFISLIANFK